MYSSLSLWIQKMLKNYQTYGTLKAIDTDWSKQDAQILIIITANTFFIYSLMDVEGMWGEGDTVSTMKGEKWEYLWLLPFYRLKQLKWTSFRVNIRNAADIFVKTERKHRTFITDSNFESNKIKFPFECFSSFILKLLDKELFPFIPWSFRRIQLHR